MFYGSFRWFELYSDRCQKMRALSAPFPLAAVVRAALRSSRQNHIHSMVSAHNDCCPTESIASACVCSSIPIWKMCVSDLECCLLFLLTLFFYHFHTHSLTHASHVFGKPNYIPRNESTKKWKRNAMHIGRAVKCKWNKKGKPSVNGNISCSTPIPVLGG